MKKRQIRLLTRQLLNGEIVKIDGELYQAVRCETKPECSMCELCGLDCPPSGLLLHVCCELDLASDGMWLLVKVV